MIASYPVGGVLWDYGQYILGLQRLGYEVFYLEDTGWLTYDPVRGEQVEDCSYGVKFLETSLADLSPEMSARWRFRAIDGKSFGMSDGAFQDVTETADIFLNVSGGTLLRDEYMKCRHKVMIDTDPGWNHFRNFPRWDKMPGWYGSQGYRAHDHFFTYAERIGLPDCPLPDFGLSWKPTRPPVVMDCWNSQPPNDKWTTVMTWKTFPETIEHDGVVYGTKELEFGKIQSVPSRVNAKMEVATGGPSIPTDEWRSMGWSVIDAAGASKSPQSYRDYLERSRGEFSVAKNVYTATRCGWFSCRSLCYMAAGLPVVVQDTGFSELIPTGQGLFAFSNLDEAVASLEEAERNYEHHGRAAKRIANDYFGSDTVLSELLTGIGL